VTGHVGGPAQVVLRARRDVAEDDFLGDAAAEQDVETVEQVQAGQEVLVAALGFVLLERWQWVRELVIASTPGSRRRGLSP